MLCLIRSVWLCGRPAVYERVRANLAKPLDRTAPHFLACCQEGNFVNCSSIVFTRWNILHSLYNGRQWGFGSGWNLAHICQSSLRYVVDKWRQSQPGQMKFKDHITAMTIPYGSWDPRDWTNALYSMCATKPAFRARQRERSTSSISCFLIQTRVRKSAL